MGHPMDGDPLESRDPWTMVWLWVMGLCRRRRIVKSWVLMARDLRSNNGFPLPDAISMASGGYFSFENFRAQLHVNMRYVLLY
jgi:hypothetical protein